MKLTGNTVKLYFEDNIVKIENLKSGSQFIIKGGHTKCAEMKEKVIAFKVTKDGVCLDCQYEIKNDETGEYVQLTINSDAEFDGNICYPEAIEPERAYREIDAYCEGIAFNVEDDIPLPEVRPLYGGSWNSMSFWGIYKPDKSWIMCAVITNFDASLKTEKGDGGLFRTSVMWLPQKGRWGYEREIRYYTGTDDPINGMCGVYRKIAEQRKLVKTLKEKSAENPVIDRSAGSADVWLWNNDAMDKLYSQNAVYSVPSKSDYELRKLIALDMKNNGMDNVMWSIFDENIDRSIVEYIKSLGYTTTYYDVYTDVIPNFCKDKIPKTRLKRCENRMPYWPDGIVVNSDGSLCPAWDLKGTDGKMYHQNRMCDAVAPDCAKKFVKEHGSDNGIDGTFIDVAVCCSYECYSKEHPTTREQAFEYKNKLFEEISKLKMFCGTENGHENAVKSYAYSEGMMSIPEYRSFDSGRRMATLYTPETTDEKIEKYMLNPKYRVPLWELVYHDCQTSYWYWGDSSNSCPHLTDVRDLYNMLYAQPPIYSFKAADWESLKPLILKSYKKTVPLSRELRYAKMMHFDYLTDDMTVQKTVFETESARISVTANFGSRDFVYGEKMIKPRDAIIDREEL